MPTFLKRAIGAVLPEPGYYGWVVVGTCLLCAALSAPGQSFAVALYLDPVAADVGLGRVEIASLYAWATLAAAAVLPLAGWLADRVSSRLFLGGVVLLMGATLLLFSRVGSWPAVGLAFFALRLLGQGATGIGAITTVLRWFGRHRARALAVATLGYAVGELVMPGVIVRLQEALGWRASLVVLGCIYALFFAPLVVLALRTRSDAERESQLESARDDRVETTARQALRMPRFWALALLASVLPFVLTGVLVNHVALFASIGWTAMDVARALQGYALASLATTYATGTLLDRMPVKAGLLLAMALLACALAVPLGFYEPAPGVLLYGALLGGAAGAANATNSVLWPVYFGVGSVGAIKGTVTTLRNALTAAAAPLAAWLAASGRGFSAVLLAGMGVAFVAALGALLLPRPGRTGAARA